MFRIRWPVTGELLLYLVRPRLVPSWLYQTVHPSTAVAEHFATWPVRRVDVSLYHRRRLRYTWTLPYPDGLLPGRLPTWTFRTFGRFDTMTFRYLPGRFATATNR